MVPNGWHSSLKLNKRTPTLSMIPGAGVFDYSCFLNRLPIIQFLCSECNKEKKMVVFRLSLYTSLHSL